MVCVLEREKSEEAKKQSKSQDPTFYTDFPARKLLDFYKGLTKIMAECNLQPLEIDADTRQILFAEMRAEGLEPDPRAVELVDIGNSPIGAKIDCCGEGSVCLEDTTDSDSSEHPDGGARKKKAAGGSKCRKRRLAGQTTTSRPPKKRVIRDDESDDDQPRPETPKPLKKRAVRFEGGDEESGVVKRFKSMKIQNKQLGDIQRELLEDDDDDADEMATGDGDEETAATQQILVDYEDSDDGEGDSEKQGERVPFQNSELLQTSFSTLRKLSEKGGGVVKGTEAGFAKKMDADLKRKVLMSGGRALKLQQESKKVQQVFKK